MQHLRRDSTLLPPTSLTGPTQDRTSDSERDSPQSQGRDEAFGTFASEHEANPWFGQSFGPTTMHYFGADCSGASSSVQPHTQVYCNVLNSIFTLHATVNSPRIPTFQVWSDQLGHESQGSQSALPPPGVHPFQHDYDCKGHNICHNVVVPFLQDEWVGDMLQSYPAPYNEFYVTPPPMQPPTQQSHYDFREARHSPDRFTFPSEQLQRRGRRRRQGP